MQVQKQQVRIEMNGQLIDDMFNYLSTRPYREVAPLIGGIQAELQAHQNKIMVAKAEADKKQKEKEAAELIELEAKKREKEELTKCAEEQVEAVKEMEKELEDSCGECDGYLHHQCMQGCDAIKIG